MDEGFVVRLCRDLHEEGYGAAEVAQLVASGQLKRIRRGGYAAKAASNAVELHRQLIAATVPMLASDACVSHISAAVVHGLPSWPDLLSRVHVIRSRPGGGRRGTVVHVHPGRLEVGDVVALEDLRLTSIARSVADCARTVSYIRAVAIGDAALRIGLDRSDLADCLGRTTGCRGAGQARRVASFIDRGGESVGESFSRILLHTAGLPVPRLQFDVRDGAGVTVARADFCWQEQRTLGEFDGRVKYGRLLKPGESPGDVVFREKVREDMVRDLGWEVVRWTWDDLDRPAVLAERLLRAFARGRRR